MKVSWDDNSQYMENNPFMFQTTNQQHIHVQHIVIYKFSGDTDFQAILVGDVSYISLLEIATIS
jgi:hypothetical protein